VLLAGGFWAAVVLEAALWSVELVLEVLAEVLGAAVLGAAVLEAAAFWSAELVPCAGGFTGALALSPCAGA